MKSVQRVSLLLQHYAILGSECMRLHLDLEKKADKILHPKVGGGL
jgi:hypothetical protein